MSTVFKSLAAKAVAASGTAEVISASNFENVIAVYLHCPTANTGIVVVGGSNTKYSATKANKIGTEIEKGSTLKIESGGNHYIDLKNIYVDAATNGDVVLISYLQVV
jgi:hypothetical protein